MPKLDKKKTILTGIVLIIPAQKTTPSNGGNISTK